jgi:trimeric autotransporter adhesin
MNTAIGFDADVGSVDLQNATAIGWGAEVTANNTIQLGNLSVTGVYTSGTYYSSGISVTSDERLKTNIAGIAAGLALINDLNPVAYRRINNEGLGIELGLLAQDVASTLERHGLADSGMVIQPDDKGYLYLRYNDLLAPMIKAIQELDDKNRTLKAQLKSQQEDLLAIVQSQQEQMLLQGGQIAQLKRMMGERVQKLPFSRNSSTPLVVNTKTGPPLLGFSR